MDKDKQAKRDKIKGMSRMQRSQDLETSWRSGKTPASGYDEADDPEFSSGSNDVGVNNTTDDGDDAHLLPGDDQSVMYMGPEDGPFECSNCVYFIADGQPCQKVSDPINAEGCCNLFESAHNEGLDQEHMEGIQGPSAAPEAIAAGAY